MKFKKSTLLATVCAAAIAVTGTAQANDLHFTGALTKSEFQEFSRQAGAAISFKNTAPAAPLGITGFDLGAEVSSTSISGSFMNKAFEGDAPSFLALPKLRARKGLPLNIDLGATYATLPGSNIKVFGVEASKALLEGSAATPAWGVRASYSRLAGVKDLNLQTAGIDTSISKGILFVTPYAGIGGVWVRSEASGALKSAAPTLGSENLFQARYFLGAKITPFPLLSVTAEAEYQERPTYSLKAAFGF